MGKILGKSMDLKTESFGIQFIHFHHSHSRPFFHIRSFFSLLFETNKSQRRHSERFSQKTSLSVVMEAIQTIGTIQKGRRRRENVRSHVKLRRVISASHTRPHPHLLLSITIVFDAHCQNYKGKIAGG